MHKLTAILLLSLFSYLTFGFGIQHAIQLQTVKSAVKQSIKKGVPHSELHTFKIPKHEFGFNGNGYAWVHPKEFSLNGQFYDIVYSDTTDNYIVIQCVSDKQETQLFQNLERLVLMQNQQNEPLKSTHSSLIQLLQSIHFQATELSFTVPHQLLSFWTLKTEVIQQFLPIHSPPPELI